MTEHDILKEVSKYPSKFIVLTGGEPTLQFKTLTPLISCLQKKGYYISLETNGTSTKTMGVDWVTVSPKLSQKGNWTLKKGDELKLIFEDQDLNFFLQSDFKHYYLQPKEILTKPFIGKHLKKESQQEWKKTINAVKNNPQWKLSFQMHKILNIP